MKRQLSALALALAGLSLGTAAHADTPNGRVAESLGGLARIVLGSDAGRVMDAAGRMADWPRVIRVDDRDDERGSRRERRDRNWDRDDDDDDDKRRRGRKASRDDDDDDDDDRRSRRGKSRDKDDDDDDDDD